MMSKIVEVTASRRISKLGPIQMTDNISASISTCILDLRMLFPTKTYFVTIKGMTPELLWLL